MKIQADRQNHLLPILLILGAAISPGTHSPALAEELFIASETDSSEKKVIVQKQVRIHEQPAWAVVGNRTYLGIEMIGLTSELREHFGVPPNIGVMVSKVQRESPAHEAGIEVGDIVTTIDTASIEAPADLAMEVAHRNEGDSVNLEVWREGRVETFQATLEERERPMIDIRRFHIADHTLDLDVIELEVPEALGDLTIFPTQVDLDPELLSEALERLNEELSNPEWHQRVMRFSEHEHGLQERIDALEERLRELETELESLLDGS